MRKLSDSGDITNYSCITIRCSVFNIFYGNSRSHYRVVVAIFIRCIKYDDDAIWNPRRTDRLCRSTGARCDSSGGPGGGAGRHVGQVNAGIDARSGLPDSLSDLSPQRPKGKRCYEVRFRQDGAVVYYWIYFDASGQVNWLDTRRPCCADLASRKPTDYGGDGCAGLGRRCARRSASWWASNGGCNAFFGIAGGYKYYFDKNSRNSLK